jgi:hypothetical protein
MPQLFVILDMPFFAWRELERRKLAMKKETTDYADYTDFFVFLRVFRVFRGSFSWQGCFVIGKDISIQKKYQAKKIMLHRDFAAKILHTENRNPFAFKCFFQFEDFLFPRRLLRPVK